MMKDEQGDNNTIKLQRIVRERTAELEKTKNYLESILKYSGDMIITTDLDTRIVTFNEGAERMLGYKRDEVIGTLMDEYYCNTEDRDRLLRIIESEGMVINCETQLVRKDGKIIDISLSLSQLKDKDGSVIGTVGISKDITEWKVARHQLKEYSQKLEWMVNKRTVELEESKSHLEAMLGGIADGVVFVNQENRVLFINDAAESIFDIKRDDWIGKSFKGAHSPESHEKALQLIKDMRSGKIRSLSSEIQAGEKTIFAHFSPIMHGQEYLGVIFIARDITDVKKLQAELVETEKFALIGKMSATIAHELRNPLVPIGGFANLIFKRLEQDSPLKKFADIIVREIERLETLLHSILYFTKEVKPVLQPANLNELINDLIFFYNDTFTANNIRLNVRMLPDLPEIQLDQSQIKQALINIFSNAIHAMPEGGTLGIESCIEDADEVSYAVIRISDTGGGIPDDIMDNIFTPFFTTKIQGLGLGLTLTKSVIESHGGKIDIEAVKGKGSSFIIRLPIK